MQNRWPGISTWLIKLFPHSLSIWIRSTSVRVQSDKSNYCDKPHSVRLSEAGFPQSLLLNAASTKTGTAAAWFAVLRAADVLLLQSPKSGDLERLKDRVQSEAGRACSGLCLHQVSPSYQCFCIDLVTTLAVVPIQFMFSVLESLSLSNKESDYFHAMAPTSAITPQLENLPSSLDLLIDENANGGQAVKEAAALQTDNWMESRLKSKSLDDAMVEPKTGLKFPMVIFADKAQEDSSYIPQELAGVGLRSVSLLKLKTIKIYAFGLYIRPDCLHQSQLSEKYGMMTPEELKLNPSFYEDILSHDLEMTVRLVVHHKGVKIGMVRSAFETSLKNRLRKIKGIDEDEGLHVFNSYFAGNLSLSQGTVIHFRRLQGGRLHTEIDGQSLGTIDSHSFCQAFFDIYIGDPPVSVKAKQDIGEKLARMLKNK